MASWAFSSPSLPAPAPAHCPPPLCPLQMEKLLLPAVDLEQWYQELMAGLGTGPAAASPRSSPPPLPAKASRQLQVTPPSLPSPAPLGSGPWPGSPVPSTQERREGLRACDWEGPSELPERRSSSSAPRCKSQSEV